MKKLQTASLSLCAIWVLVWPGIAAEFRPHVHRSGDLLCTLVALPGNAFTTVAAPAQLRDGRFRPESAILSVTYGPGFTSNPQAQAAFQYAVNIWQTQLTSTVPITIAADFTTLGPGVLAQAGFNQSHLNFPAAPIANTWFPEPIANALTGSALSSSTQIDTTFGSGFNWYFGTDAFPAQDQYDFVSVVLHELGHGLGFVASMRVSGGTASWGSGTGYPLVFDRYLANGSSQSLIDTATFPNGSAALAAQLTSDNVFWTGSHGVAGNGGTRPRIYAPFTWAGGSSISHLDDSTYPEGNANSLMTHAIFSAEAIHDPGPVTRGILRDSGWPLAPGCTYTLSPSAFSIGQSATVGTVGVTTTAGCPWTAVSNSSFITVTGGPSGTGSGVVTYSASANAGALRTGTITIAGQTFTLTQAGASTTAPTISSHPSSQTIPWGQSASLNTVATGAAPLAYQWYVGTSGTTTSPVSGATSSSYVTPALTTTTSYWVRVSNGLGSVNSNTATITVTSTPAPPFGSFDTPAHGSSVAGSIAVTGWALDNGGVDRVEIWRDRAAGETTPVYSGPGPGNGKIFIANAFFVTGARPDVASAYAIYPQANRAGWGYLMLTQGLWNQGNGTYTLYAFAYDQGGLSAPLGSKTITVTNATAIKPFGNIDTPAFGQTVSGGFWNFGWALTPNANPSCIIGGTQVQMRIDSGALVTVNYGALRNDIALAFPGLTNSGGAGGAYYIDTTTLSNGTHQIGWFVTDSCGRAEGIGSRFFTVQNGSSVAANTSAPAATAAPATDAAPVSSPIDVRRGVESTLVYPGLSGTRVVPIGQNERIEIVLPSAAGRYTGAQIAGGERRALPAGSSLDADAGVFSWQPATGFLGAHDLEFVASSGDVVRVRAVVGTSVQAVIDTPQPGEVITPFAIAGWAIDEAAASGTGIDTVHVWAYPAAGGGPVFLGVASYGGVRPDLAAVFGEQFAGASFSLAVQGLAPGVYDIVAYPYSSVTRDFRGAQVVRVTVQ